MKLIISLSLISLLIVTGCTPELAPNKRVLVQGVVKNSEGQGVAGALVNVSTERYTNILFSNGKDQYFLGSGRSAVDGGFAITSLFDQAYDFTIAVDAGAGFTKYFYLTNTSYYTPADLTFNLGEVTVKKIAELNYSITKVSNSDSSILYSIEYENPICVKALDQGEATAEGEGCFERVELQNILNSPNPNISSTISTTLGSIIKFTYSINGEPSITETFTIDQANYVYEFQY